jgi:S-adenosylmethionine synthetase
MKNKVLFTSESVSEGHPDKICDQISDAILDECLKRDCNAKVAVECLVSEQTLVIAGQITLKAGIEQPDYESIARRVISEIGYNDKRLGFSSEDCSIIVNINKQSLEIKSAVEHFKLIDTCAGDQGIMFGYASNEDRNYMPLAIVIAHKLVRTASSMRKEGKFPHALPDMKSQVTIDYADLDNIRIDNVLMSVQHEANIDIEKFKQFIRQKIIIPVVKKFNKNTDFSVYINTGGSFTVGGPIADTGLTGRKIIVDTYGGASRHGGGAFSGKDATKVDRSAAYMARYIAKNLVAAGVAQRLEVQLAYGIGMSKPLSYSIFTYKTRNHLYDDAIIIEVIKRVFDCRPGAIIKQFSLNKPVFRYQDLATYGHFGRKDLPLPWERLDKVQQIKKLLIELSNLDYNTTN